MPHSAIGFIGLGDIGKPMAANLLNRGFKIFSSANRSRQAFEELIPQGLVEKASPREVAEASDILITMVVDEAQTETVLRGEAGALAGLKPGSTIIVMSTLKPGYCQDLANELAERDIAVIDCPVSGMAVRAADGTLTLMAGGRTEDIERCRQVLEAMGTIHYCGDVGMGMVAKLANNGLSMGTAGLLVEMRRMAKSYGMDIPTLMEILGSGTAASFVVQNFEMFRPNWRHFARIAGKDMRICQATGAANGGKTPMIDAWLSVAWAEMGPEDV